MVWFGATAPIRHLPWDLPYAAGAALKRPKKKKKKKGLLKNLRGPLWKISRMLFLACLRPQHLALWVALLAFPSCLSPVMLLGGGSSSQGCSLTLRAVSWAVQAALLLSLLSCAAYCPVPENLLHVFFHFISCIKQEDISSFWFSIIIGSRNSYLLILVISLRV